MSKVRIEVVADFGPRKGQVVCGIDVDTSHNSLLKVVQNTLQLERKDANLVTLSVVDLTGARILPHGDLRDVLHDGARVVVSKTVPAEVAEAAHEIASDGRLVQRSQWPPEAFTTKNAGVMLVGKSKKHHGVPVTLLGGRFYTRKRIYAYADFGGGVEWKNGETPQQGAIRECMEELLGQTSEEARATASKLCSVTASNLVGGRPFIHRSNYAVFIIPAEVVVEALQLSVDEDESAIDVLFAKATRNPELTSVALVSIEELLRAARCDGQFHPLSLRQFDETNASSTGTVLRSVMVGPSGSIVLLRGALEGSDRTNECAQPAVLQQRFEVSAWKDVSRVHAMRRRWNRAPKVDELAGPMDAYLQNASKHSNSTLEASANAKSPRSCAQRKRCHVPKPELSPYIFDMETGDPDDVLTLLFLASHPGVELRAVTITPGSDEQVALVRWILQKLGLTHVRMGAQCWPSNASKPSDWSAGRFYRSFGRSKDGEPKCERADHVLAECCDESVTLVTGAPLHNLGDALKIEGFSLGRWVAQGGFAGEGVVPLEKQMDKFRGKTYCPTWNFGGNIAAAQAALASLAIERKICVSKNVCHSVVYDRKFHGALREALAVEVQERPHEIRTIALMMVFDAMDEYLRHNSGGKKLHDPLALATAFDETVCELVEVELLCHNGRWGSRLRPGSNVWISISYDAPKFKETLLR